MIIPKQFLKTIKNHLEKFIFEMRYDENGKLIDDFVLNISHHNTSKILIAGNNFGVDLQENTHLGHCWFGIACVINSSYADIFYSNCFKMEYYEILEEEKIKELSEYAKRQEEISIDLNNKKIIYGNNETQFKIDPFKKKCLLEGLDDIALSLKKTEKIKNFENNLKDKKPWIFND